MASLRTLVLVHLSPFALSLPPVGLATATEIVRHVQASATILAITAQLDGLPTLDLRFLAADHLWKAAKIDESGTPVTVASATVAGSGMRSRFDIVSDEDERDD